jgi:flavin reductase (DIM6/NTAB) family NADH-FMN oxidoreductase RutF
MTVAAPAAQDLPRDVFLSAMRQAASPVCVVTTQSEGQRMALTISSFLSISADPPLISVCINRNSRMCSAMTESGCFGVHLLAHDQAHVADNFAGRPQSGEAYDFSCVEWIDQSAEGEPFMSGVSVSADCAVVSTTDAGTHRLFIASVRSLTTNDKRPLLYWNRLYGFPSHPGDAQK